VQSPLNNNRGMSPPKGTARRPGIREASRRKGTTRPKDVWRRVRRGVRSHARRPTFGCGRDVGRAPGSYALGIGQDAQAIIDRVKALDSGQLGDRYHELADRRLRRTLDFTELFELERIEARLDAEDHDETADLTTLQENWHRERDALVASIENLVAHFKTAG